MVSFDPIMVINQGDQKLMESAVARMEIAVAGLTVTSRSLPDRGAIAGAPCAGLSSPKRVPSFMRCRLLWRRSSRRSRQDQSLKLTRCIVTSSRQHVRGGGSSWIKPKFSCSRLAVVCRRLGSEISLMGSIGECSVVWWMPWITRSTCQRLATSSTDQPQTSWRLFTPSSAVCSLMVGIEFGIKLGIKFGIKRSGATSHHFQARKRHINFKHINFRKGGQPRDNQPVNHNQTFIFLFLEENT